MFRVGCKGSGDGWAVEDGFTHIDGDCVVCIHYGDDGSSEGVDSIGFS